MQQQHQQLAATTKKKTKQLARHHNIMAVQELTPEERSAVGYANATLIQGTFPYRKTTDHTHTVKNGNMTLTMSSINGLPYGVYPRLIMCWLVKAAQMNHLDYDKDDPERLRISFGTNLAAFMRDVGIDTRYGKNSTSDRTRDQLLRLFSTTLSVQRDYTHDGDNITTGHMTLIGKAWKFRWNSEDPHRFLHDSHVILTEEFFDMLVNNAVPIDMDIVRHIKSSAIALDVFMWLSYRFSYLRRPTIVPLTQLMGQFGTKMDPQDPVARRNFTVKLKKALAKIHEIWPDAKVSVLDGGKGLMLKPTAPSVGRKNRKKITRNTK